jgi:aspartokinase
MSASNTNVTLALPPLLSSDSKSSTDFSPKESLRRLITEIERVNLGIVTVDRGFAVVSVVGENMWNESGLTGRCCKAIADEGINIEMLSLEASRISACIVVREEVAITAVRAVHKEYFTEESI